MVRTKLDCGKDANKTLSRKYCPQYAKIAVCNDFANEKQIREALDAYKQAIRIDPGDAGAYFGLGLAYGDLGMHKEEIDAFKQVIRIDPDDELAHSNIGFAYRELGMNKEAIEPFKQVIRIDPDNVEAHCNLDILYN